MKKQTLYFVIVLISVLTFSNCAKKGTPTGGAKDTIPPMILKSNPENFTTHFTGDEIRIYFDENIKMKDLQQNLIISPPLTYQPIITPLTSSKVLKIKILDTLRDNTTYVFNFGKSITDNNEGNAFDYFKYVFSTGNYIDSLTVKGMLQDALLPTLDKKTTVMLYEYSELFKDSILFSEKPNYITTTKDKDSSFELTNLKEGSYILVALQEETNNYTFEPKKDKIAFLENYITIPQDTAYNLTLFKEIPEFKMARPSHISKNKIVFGFEGAIDSLTIEPLSNLPTNFTSKMIKDPKKDSLNYFFKPEIVIEENDTLYFVAKNQGLLDTLVVKMRDLFSDSLNVVPINKNFVIPNDSIKIGANTPLVSVNPENISVMNADSINLPITVFLDSIKNEAAVVFPKEENQMYRVTVLPEAFQDFFSKTNDTLQFTVKTKPVSDYGTLTFSLQNIDAFPVIVELVNDKFIPIKTQYLTENKEIYFDYIDPNTYYLRIIYDTNYNKRWDTGHFLRKIQPEKIVYYPKQIEIRSNWDVNEVFILE